MEYRLVSIIIYVVIMHIKTKEKEENNEERSFNALDNIHRILVKM